MKSDFLPDKLGRTENYDRRLKSKILEYINSEKPGFDRRNRRHRVTKMYFDQIVIGRLTR